MDKVSIIVPIYNVKDYLEECLNSIMKQTHKCWEAILIDDGSTDGSETICNKYQVKDERFKVLHKENGGAASAKNCGLDLVTGQYIAFLDSDDYVESTWLESALSVLENEKADIVEYNFDKIYFDRTEMNNSIINNSISFTTKEYLKQYPNKWECSLFWNKVFKKDLLNTVRFKKERRCIDDEFFTYKGVANAKKIVCINKILYHYRQRESSAISNVKHQLQITNDALDVLVERYCWMKENFPDVCITYLKHDINILFYYATMQHNSETAKKFKHISHFYLKEALKSILLDRIILDVLRLQFIRKKDLMREKQVMKREDNSFK